MSSWPCEPFLPSHHSRHHNLQDHRSSYSSQQPAWLSVPTIPQPPRPFVKSLSALTSFHQLPSSHSLPGRHRTSTPKTGKPSSSNYRHHHGGRRKIDPFVPFSHTPAPSSRSLLPSPSPSQFPSPFPSSSAGSHDSSYRENRSRRSPRLLSTFGSGCCYNRNCPWVLPIPCTTCELVTAMLVFFSRCSRRGRSGRRPEGAVRSAWDGKVLGTVPESVETLAGRKSLVLRSRLARVVAWDGYVSLVIKWRSRYF